ncbi:hypothetical protein J6590_000997 [Homalodisca vitripennis]|nr:hypothetical protein J6590_000997 [Homalodisca vitripennis]
MSSFNASCSFNSCVLLPDLSQRSLMIDPRLERQRAEQSGLTTSSIDMLRMRRWCLRVADTTASRISHRVSGTGHQDVGHCLSEVACGFRQFMTLCCSEKGFGTS